MNDEIIWEESQYAIIKRKPTLGNLVPTNLRPASLHEKLRWLVQFFYGYNVYVLVEKLNEGGHTEIGYCFIGDGGNFRYTFAEQGDAIVGPYYIIPEMRGHSLASMLICSGLDDYAPRTGTAWDFIQHNNTASIKTSEIAGFAYYSDCKYSGLLRKLNVCEYSMGDQQLFCKRG